eukprot:TRINITY_DN5386_c0_g1_i3.p2 TRINITY_DN5386_c0_g1~~TRINITY_DN5386_c0_g1_i3.p2  ORF type:complete len:160 (-),score=13.48 TRINITY_DN5386_c0_g1_i3:100-579(-)
MESITLNRPRRMGAPLRSMWCRTLTRQRLLLLRCMRDCRAVSRPLPESDCQVVQTDPSALRSRVLTGSVRMETPRREQLIERKNQELYQLQQKVLSLPRKERRAAQSQLEALQSEIDALHSQRRGFVEPEPAPETNEELAQRIVPVSYTHLTLPTKRIV